MDAQTPRLASRRVRLGSILARLHVAGVSIPRYLLASDLDENLIRLKRSAQRLREVGEFARSVDEGYPAAIESALGPLSGEDVRGGTEHTGGGGRNREPRA